MGVGQKILLFASLISGILAGKASFQNDIDFKWHCVAALTESSKDDLSITSSDVLGYFNSLCTLDYDGDESCIIYNTFSSLPLQVQLYFTFSACWNGASLNLKQVIAGTDNNNNNDGNELLLELVQLSRQSDPNNNHHHDYFGRLLEEFIDVNNKGHQGMVKSTCGDGSTIAISLDEDGGIESLEGFCYDIFEPVVYDGIIDVTGQLAPSLPPTLSSVPTTKLPTTSPSTQNPVVESLPPVIQTEVPTSLPIKEPIASPTHSPTRTPTKVETNKPSVSKPTNSPTFSSDPPVVSSGTPTRTPTKVETNKPSVSKPTNSPIFSSDPPVIPSGAPTVLPPSSGTTLTPTEKPVIGSSDHPSYLPTASVVPTVPPSRSSIPTRKPTLPPTRSPSVSPAPTCNSGGCSTFIDVRIDFNVYLNKDVTASDISDDKELLDDISKALKVVIENPSKPSKDTIRLRHRNLQESKSGVEVISVYIEETNESDCPNILEDCKSGFVFLTAVTVLSNTRHNNVDFIVSNEVSKSIENGEFLKELDNEEVVGLSYRGNGAGVSLDVKVETDEPILQTMELIVVSSVSAVVIIGLLVILTRKEGKSSPKEETLKENAPKDNSQQLIQNQLEQLDKKRSSSKSFGGLVKPGMYSQLTSDLPQSRMMGYNPETYKKELALMNKERSTRNIVDVNPEKYAPSLEEKGSLGSRSRSCSESGSLLNPELFVHGSLKEPTPVNSEEINGNNQKDTDLSSRHHHYKSFAEQVEKAVSKGDWRVVEQLAKSANKDGGRPESPVSSLDSRSVSENSSQPRPRLSIIDQDRASRVSKLIEENDWAAVEAAAANFGDEDSSRMHKENRNSATSAASSLTVDSGADNDNDEQFKRTVTSILLKVAPEEAKNVSALIEQFQGREAELLATLHSMFEQKIEKDRSDQKLQPPDHYSPAEEGAVSDDRRDSLSSMLGLSDASSHESLSQGEKEKNVKESFSLIDMGKNQVVTSSSLPEQQAELKSSEMDPNNKIQKKEIEKGIDGFVEKLDESKFTDETVLMKRTREEKSYSIVDLGDDQAGSSDQAVEEEGDDQQAVASNSGSVNTSDSSRGGEGHSRSISSQSSKSSFDKLNAAIERGDWNAVELQASHMTDVLAEEEAAQGGNSSLATYTDNDTIPTRTTMRSTRNSTVRSSSGGGSTTRQSISSVGSGSLYTLTDSEDGHVDEIEAMVNEENWDGIIEVMKTKKQSK